jgi:hypothetical protein
MNGNEGNVSFAVKAESIKLKDFSTPRVIRMYLMGIHRKQ